MRAVIQRVKEACVRVDGKITGQIEKGLLVLVGVEDADTDEDIEWLTKKIAGMRIFDDENGVMNLSVMDIDGRILADRTPEEIFADDELIKTAGLELPPLIELRNKAGIPDSVMNVEDLISYLQSLN